MPVSIIILVDYRVNILSGGIISFLFRFVYSSLQIKAYLLNVLLDHPVMHNNL